jgi:hypothetical protein
VPALKARHISQDFELSGSLDDAAWETAKPVFIDQQAVDAGVVPKMSTPVRALWSDRFLYLAYECPFTKLTIFPGPTPGERFDLQNRGASLWDRDVVEAFVGTEPSAIRKYSEFEVAPSNEKLDVQLDLSQKDFAWKSGFESAVKIDPKKRVWTCEMRIPWGAFAGKPPAAGTVWRLNLFRCDRANAAFLAWRPPLTSSFHTPGRFGLLEFVD